MRGKRNQIGRLLTEIEGPTLLEPDPPGWNKDKAKRSLEALSTIVNALNIDNLALESGERTALKCLRAATQWENIPNARSVERLTRQYVYMAKCLLDPILDAAMWANGLSSETSEGLYSATKVEGLKLLKEAFSKLEAYGLERVK